ncbi:MAG: EamA family transporter [Chitinophagaceae bacterium]
MIYLVGSIVFTSWLTLAFKVVERWRIDTFQAIVYNYLACVITGSVVHGSVLNYGEIVTMPWFGWSCLMGAVFIGLFNIIGFTTQKMGVAVASVANKLSLVIPFVFSVILYNEKATWLKITGIAIALAAVVLTCYPKKKQGASTEQGKRHSWLYLLPVVLFIGSGLLDTMIKYVEQGYLNNDNKNLYLITAFSVAAAIGLLVLLAQYITGKRKFSYKGVLAGIMIGVPNYFSIWCLLQVLKQYSDNSSAIIPINNMGIVLFSAVVAWLLFKEKLSVINWAGIVLAIGAIALVAYG